MGFVYNVGEIGMWLGFMLLGDGGGMGVVVRVLFERINRHGPYVVTFNDIVKHSCAEFMEYILSLSLKFGFLGTNLSGSWTRTLYNWLRPPTMESDPEFVSCAVVGTSIICFRFKNSVHIVGM